MDNRTINFIGSIDEKMSCEELKKMYDLGVKQIRLNMSYRLDYYDTAVDKINETNKKYGIDIKLMCDLAGKEMRVTNKLPFFVKKGQKIIIGKDLCFDQGDVSLLQKDDKILINDGQVILVVDKYCDGFLYCISENEDKIYPNANAYNSKLYSSLPFISEKDMLNLNDAIRYKADFVAVSHVCSKDDLEQVRKHLNKNDLNIKLISKIENEEAIKNLDEIIENSDGVMIARGDLAKILPIYDLGYNQKIITEKTLESGKLLISATDYLASLKENITPTRAEVIDLFSAFNDGIKSIMFSKELVLSIDRVNFLTIANNIYNSYLKYKKNYK